MAEVVEYLTLIGKRVYRPLRPALKPLLQLIKVVRVLIILLIVELLTIFWPLPVAVTLKNNLAAWPWSNSARKSTELVINEPAVIASKISAWEKVLTEENESPDGLLNLAVLHFQLYHDDQARLFWEQAFYLDPERVSLIHPQLF